MLCRLLPLLVLPAVVGCQSEPRGPAPGPDLQAPWPDWALGHWVWEDESTQQSASDLVHGYLDRDIPVAAIIIDSPWETGYNTFEWDLDRFPDPEGFIEDMHDNDVRVVLWIVPAINADQDLWQEAADSGFFMQQDADSGPAVFDWWKGEGSLIDYFNPEAVVWWHGQMDKALAYDIDGWKCDGLDFQAQLTSYSPGAGSDVDRLTYSHAYYRDFFVHTRRTLGDDRLIMSRPNDSYGLDLGGETTAFTPREIAWAAWVGDQDATFEGMQAALLNLHLSAESNYVVIGSDIGGYRDMGPEPQGRSKEVFVRWAQLGALNPLMENGGGGDHHPWAWDRETERIYARYVDLHLALGDYLSHHGNVALRDGGSLMHFLGKQDDYRYLLGPDLFVAPILAEGGRRKVVFPDEGAWVYLFDGDKRYEAGAIETVTFPLDEYPVYVREGSELEGLVR